MSTVVSILTKLLLALIMTVLYVEITRDRPEDSLLHRTRRHSFAPLLVYPSGTVFQINIAVQNPFPVPNKTVAISMGLQFNFVMPTNISEFRQTKKPKREAPGQVLLSIYQPLEALLEDYGFEGRACVLRSICEAAGSPFKHEGSDLLDEIAHIILTPSEEDSMTHFDCNGNSSSLQHLQEEHDYLVAECLGKTGKDCSAVYADCFEPPLDLMSNVYHVDYSF